MIQLFIMVLTFVITWLACDLTYGVLALVFEPWAAAAMTPVLMFIAIAALLKKAARS